jgi:bacillolysin
MFSPRCPSSHKVACKTAMHQNVAFQARLLAAFAFAFVGALTVPTTAPAAGLPARAAIERSAQTGFVRFVGSAAGRPLPRPAGFTAASAPSAVGRAFLRKNAAAFGLAAADGLRTGRTFAQPGGATTVRYQQVIDGVPVLAGEFAVTLDSENRILSVGGEALPHASVATTPLVDVAEAARRAEAAVVKADAVPAGDLSSESAGLQILDARLIGGREAPQSRLVWSLEVRSATRVEVRRQVYVDAESGVVVLTIDQTHELKNRSVCDANNVATPANPRTTCTAPTLTEGGSTAGKNADVLNAYDYAGATYDLYSGLFGRDSLDGAGMPLKSTVKYCEAGSPCPYANAFWDGRQMYYGQGFPVADDVVGHELTHGVTDFTSSLLYFMESGAINESMSDIFGEAVDQLTAGANDAAADKWKLGESVPGFGAVRDMANPPAFGDPDRMGSAFYDKGDTDSGGVHTNSGVNNKAAFLIADGGTFNSRTVSGLGLTKMLRVYYAVATGFLTSGSDYADLGSYLVQACTNLVGTSGVVTADCAQVGAAVDATEMQTVDVGAPPEAVTCSGGLVPRNAFFDDMEGVINWSKETDSGLLADNAWDFSDLYATSGDWALVGPDPSALGDHSAALISGVTVPTGGFLRIRHYHFFETSGTSYWDGGWVEYKSGAGPWTTLTPEGGYPGTIRSTAPADNPQKGHPAFIAGTRGYTSARFSLAGLAGQAVRLRFRIASDSSGAGDGWFIDDVRVYRCVDPTPPDTTIVGGPADGSTISERSPQFTFAASEPGSSFECKLDTAPDFSLCPSPYTPSALADGTHRLEVRARDVDDNVDASPAVRTFAVQGPTTTTTTTTTPPNPTPAGSQPILRVQLLRGKVKSALRKATFKWRATGNVGAARFECKLDKGKWKRCKPPVTYAKLRPGKHVFRVRARDARNERSTVVTLKFRVQA